MPETLSEIPQEEIDRIEINNNRKDIVSQIDIKTGLSDEFRNQFLEFLIAFKHNLPRIDMAGKFYEDIKAEGGFKKYLDMFSQESFDNVVNDRNREAITILNNKINELWLKLQDVYKNTITTEHQTEKINSFIKLDEEIDKIIKGKSEI